MEALEEVRLRMRISNLRARKELREIEMTALTREISSPLTSLERRNEAQECFDAARKDWTKVLAELRDVRYAFPHIVTKIEQL